VWPASRPTRLCYATSGHNCKLCIYYTKLHNSFGFIYIPLIVTFTSVARELSAKEMLDSYDLRCICGLLEDSYVDGRYQVDIKWGI